MKQFEKLHLPSSKFYAIIHYCTTIYIFVHESDWILMICQYIYIFLFRALRTLTVACISSLIWAEPNSCFNVAFVEAYNIFCLTGALSGDQLNSNHSWPREFFESNLKKMTIFLWCVMCYWDSWGWRSSVGQYRSHLDSKTRLASEMPWLLKSLAEQSGSSHLNK